MQNALSIGVLLVVSILPGCSSPVRPTQNDETNARYALQIVVSDACPAGGQGTMFQRSFNFEVIGSSSESPLFRLASPFSGSPNTGDLVLRFTATRGSVSGTVSGFGLSANGVHTFGVHENQNRVGMAPVLGTNPQSGTFEGTFSGYVTFSIFRTAAGGECTASNHSWRLTRQN